MAEATITAQDRPPLGIPRCSVRALLAVLVVAVVILQLGRGESLPILWKETLLIVLTHYFTARHSVPIPLDAYRRLQAEGVFEKMKQPLYLPRHTIRGLIVVAFVGLAIYLYNERRLFQWETLSTLGTVFSYFLGLLITGAINWVTGGEKSRPVQWWDDLKAVLSIAVLLVTAGAYFADRPEVIPQTVRESSLGIVLFYFGSRR